MEPEPLRYRSLNSYLLETFGEKVYKLALDGGFTCPNRDGTLDTRGCIFCAGGSGNFAVPVGEDVYGAIEKAKAVVAAKTGAGKFIAYYQSYTGTYAPLPRLEQLYRATLAHPDIVALSIGTRPDCLPPETVALLAELNKIKPVWVELGLQTIHPATAEYIRRGYPLEVFDGAMARLKSAGLYTIVHMIVGLPGETEEMMAQTAEYIGKSGAGGIKIQLLHVLKHTDLERDYSEGKFRLPELPEYIEILKACLRRLPPDMTIHRLTGDGDKRELVAPLWSGDKKRVLNTLRRSLEPF